MTLGSFPICVEGKFIRHNVQKQSKCRWKYQSVFRVSIDETILQKYLCFLILRIRPSGIAEWHKGIFGGNHALRAIDRTDCYFVTRFFIADGYHFISFFLKHNVGVEKHENNKQSLLAGYPTQTNMLGDFLVGNLFECMFSHLRSL